MAQNLPKIVRDLSDLTVEVLKVTRNFPKPWRPNLAQKIEHLTVEAFLSVRQFVLVSQQEKTKNVDQLKISISHIDDVEALLGICHELKTLSDGKYGELLIKVVEIRKQLFGLKNKYELAYPADG